MSDSLPNVPPEVWARFEALVRSNFGPQKAYIAAQKKERILAGFKKPSVSADPLRFAPRRFRKTVLQAMNSLQPPSPRETQRVADDSLVGPALGISVERIRQLRKLR